MGIVYPPRDVSSQDSLEGYRIYAWWFEGQCPNHELILILLRYMTIFGVSFHRVCLNEVLAFAIKSILQPNKAKPSLYDNVLLYFVL